jgi:hypothetical protein
MNDILSSKRGLVVDDDPAFLALTAVLLRNQPGSEVVRSFLINQGDNPERSTARLKARVL